jgi:hypothetical protein
MMPLQRVSDRQIMAAATSSQHRMRVTVVVKTVVEGRDAALPGKASSSGVRTDPSP